MNQKVSDVCKHSQGKGKQDHLSVVFLERNPQRCL